VRRRARYRGNRVVLRRRKGRRLVRSDRIHAYRRRKRDTGIFQPGVSPRCSICSYENGACTYSPAAAFDSQATARYVRPLRHSRAHIMRRHVAFIRTRS
jgi:hypothetical protein